MSPRHKLLISCLAALLLAPLPAAAREAGRGDEAPGDIARRLADPRNQIAATVALTAVTEALLDMKVDPLRRVLAAAGDDRAENLPPDARLRDLAGPEAQDLPGEIGRNVPQAMGSAAAIAGSFSDVLPELRATIERLKAALPQQ